ncbi:putative dehydrogenase [Frankia casuarinae]|uniref:Oxidoreductase-like n=1 Tax=Frankia casuarinae (strain DSM 45818 / CECT 9043 / HFP020203 / CcI3) TaxID=106370 RepID=Q2JDH6_FRACC|nr:MULTISPECIES: Gfo/Idh/MocA family oxidoreductase [Frankia]ABD10666.1 oxidoreductase-like [Frankia casuarinae]ETA02932.1 putative dehydrogenase [Frankia sp. CcI6]EYT93422.1 putative dehydrogenase [Frankia casuarinae]KDA43542.1 putative dehydrogenase [Frankia sp. BMG5.23]OHV55260.1 oxidoreductase [Frankia sp. CgIS1]
MNILIGNRWLAGFLDETPLPGHCRIRPDIWVTLFPVDGQFFVRAGSSRALAAYTREFGIRAVARKTASRLRERDRNQRYFGMGLGTLIEAVPPVSGAASPTGTTVAFVAPCHPACMERVVLHQDLVRPVGPGGPTGAPADPLGFVSPDPPPPRSAVVYRARPATAFPAVDDTLIGWSPMSGAPVDPGAVDRLVAWLATEWTGARPGDRPLAGVSPITESTRRYGPPSASGRPTAVLFGLGHYAKTQIVPHVRDHLDLVGVHEIDPVQLGTRRPDRCSWDTAALLRDGERADVVLIAGYHHTHAPLARDALRLGSVAVVEKPVVTTEEDLGRLVKLLHAGGRLFACFQRRHSPMNAWLRSDLRLADGNEPLIYSAVVYEEPLPRRHWYRWPSSRTRLVSNGCHWIDHFLWLNDFAPVRRSTVARSRTDTFTVYVELENDAVLSLVLTSAGGSRHGLREQSQLRANGVTATIVDGSQYTAEAGSHILRRRRVNRLDSYPAMYRDICAGIVAGAPGEDARQIAAVAALTLRLDAAAGRDGPEP